MLILSTGDLHFNCGYDEDILASMKQIVDYVYANPISLVAITGDIYDRASDPSSRNLAADSIRTIADKVPVIIVRGNHDAIGDLLIYSKLKAKNYIMVYEAPQLLEFDAEKVMIHAMPWLTKSRWQSLHAGASKEEGDKTVSQMVLDFMKNNIALNPGYKHVLVGHMTIAGARCGAHQQMSADGITLGVYDIKDAGFSAAMLGHIHLRQEIGGSSYFYNGSVAALDYGEDPDKYFSVYDTELDEVEWVELKTIHRQDVSARWTPQGVDMDYVEPELLKRARIRANLRVEGGDNVAAAKAELAEILTQAGCLEFQIRPQVIAESAVRSMEISKAIGMSEKLKEYWKVSGAPDKAVQDDMLDKLDDLEDTCCLSN